MVAAPPVTEEILFELGMILIHLGDLLPLESECLESLERLANRSKSLSK